MIVRHEGLSNGIWTLRSNLAELKINLKFLDVRTATSTVNVRRLPDGGLVISRGYGTAQSDAHRAQSIILAGDGRMTVLVRDPAEGTVDENGSPATDHLILRADLKSPDVETMIRVLIEAIHYGEGIPKP